MNDKPVNHEAAVAAYTVSMDKVLEGKLDLTRREDYRWGFYEGWLANPREFTLAQMLEAIKYGFEYHRDSMNDGQDVPEGNKLQWLLSKFVSVEDHAKWIEAHKG